MDPRVSYVVNKSTRSHPLQAVMEGVVREGGAIRDIWKDVHKQAKQHKTTPTVFDAKAMMEYAKKAGHYDALLAMVKKFKQGEDKSRLNYAQSDVRPPGSHCLYERVQPDTSIVDVGVGDGKRVARYQGYFGNVKGVDKVKKSMVADWPEDWQVEVRGMGPEPEVVTSFNLMGQLDEKERQVMCENDGIHIWAVQGTLECAGHVTVRGDVAEVDMIDAVFEEPVVKRELPYYPIGRYYGGTNTYRSRDINLLVKGKAAGQPAKGKYVRLRHRPTVQRMTWKYDGVLLNLRNRNGRFKILGRDGKGYWGVSNEKDSFDLDLEQVGSEHYLLRVNDFRGFRPFHSLEMLRVFTKKVKIKLMGCEILAPGAADKCTNEPVFADGFVYRDREIDFVVNWGVSLDLKGGRKDELDRYLLDRRCALSIEHSGWDPGFGMCSVMVREPDNGIFRIEWKQRYDKQQEDNNWDEKFSLMTVDKLRNCPYGLKGEQEDYQDGLIVIGEENEIADPEYEKELINELRNMY